MNADAITIALAATGLVLGCGSPCSNLREVAHSSPDGRFEAVVFDRTCGSLGPHSTNLSVLETGTKQGSGQGNVMNFEVQGGDPETFGERTRIGVAWSSSTVLEVFHDEDIKVHRRESSMPGVEIRYRRKQAARHNSRPEALGQD